VWIVLLLLGPVAGAADLSVSSPDGKITAKIVFDEKAGIASYTVTGGGAPLIDKSPLGITTDRGDFTAGMALAGSDQTVVDETYTLPVGKRSTYVDHANELVLKLRKGQQELHVRFRAYDDGVAFSYAMPGSGDVQISGEASAFALSGGDITYWGQPHPNNFGYETMLGRIDGDRFSVPVLARLGERNHFVFLAQAATYGTYVMPHFRRDGSTLKVAFPMDQEGPVKTTLPFQSPWRLAVISPGNLGQIVETTMLENLNPPTEPRLAGADWIKAGRASWDFLAGDRANTRKWLDFDVTMGWEYHVVDSGFQRTLDVPAITKYAAERNVRVIGWARTSDVSTRQTAQEVLSQYAGWGLKGAKLDFFDHNPFTGNRRTDDFEDTQASLQIRDNLLELGAKLHLVLEFHGCTIPSGERRRYPHFMSAEAVAGMEKKNSRPEHELTIPYVRNVMGPVSFTVVKFDRSIGTPAYQMAQAVVYEAGIQIFAEHYDKLLAFKGVDFLKKVPANWDQTHFVEGYPETHAIFARRKGDDWFVAAITNKPRTASIPLGFLAPGKRYAARIYRDGESKSDLLIEEKTVSGTDTLAVPLLQSGGCAAYLHPIEGK
jgi:alpha-glucosidase